MPNWRQVMWFGVAFVVIAGGSVASGLAMLFTREPDPSIARGLNGGARRTRAKLDSTQDLHDNLGTVMIAGLLVGGAYLMLKVKQDWSGRFASALIPAIAAVVTGIFIGVEAVQVNGAFVEDQRGYGFIFDDGFEGVRFGGRFMSAGTYQVLFTLHLVAAVLTVVAVIVGIRDVMDPHGTRKAERLERKRGATIDA